MLDFLIGFLACFLIFGALGQRMKVFMAKQYAPRLEKNTTITFYNPTGREKLAVLVIQDVTRTLDGATVATLRDLTSVIEAYRVANPERTET
jgi:hypothetical protein